MAEKKKIRAEHTCVISFHAVATATVLSERPVKGRVRENGALTEDLQA